MKIGKLIKSYRINKFITLSDLAKEIGTSAYTLSRIENTKFKPDLDTYTKILNWLITD